MIAKKVIPAELSFRVFCEVLIGKASNACEENVV